MKIRKALWIDYFQLQKFSLENNKNNNGNLSYTFFEMIPFLEKKNIKPQIFTLKDNNNILGYCICYFSDVNTIQISQICMGIKYQNKSYAKKFIDFFKKQVNTLTADIKITNEQSQKFFIKNGFSLELKPNKKYYRAVWKS